MIKIGIIVPKNTIATAELAAEKFQENIRVFQGSMAEGVDLAKQLDESGYDIIIARGVTQILLQDSNLNTPVLKVPITAIDIFEAIKEAEEISKEISLLIAQDMVTAVETYLRISGKDIKVFKVDNDLQIKEKLNDFTKDKTEVVVGIGILEKYAPLYGLKSVIIKSGLEAFIFAIEEARRMSAAMVKEKKDKERLESIVENSYEGIVCIDDKGNIIIFNDSAQKLIKHHNEKIVGQNIESIFPEIGLKDTLFNGEKEIGIIREVNNTKFMVNKIPIIVDNQVVNAVAILRDLDDLQKAEEEIRREAIRTGHYARYTFQDVIGSSQAIKDTIRIGKEYAKVEASILIQGETGTGKEVFAQSIHNYSNRDKGPFVAVNCAALPESLLESELFGYNPGAFTGAGPQGKKGLFELAHKGTIFLDEISEMDLAMQGRLLRVLQEKQVMRLGGNKITPIDVRVIVATNKNLHSLVRSGEFREDLYYRLDVLRMDILPLRNRIEDVTCLLNFFIEEYCDKFGKKIMTFSLEAMEYLSRYTWPGNVREIRNFCERLSIATNKSEITLEDVRKHIKHNMARDDDYKVDHVGKSEYPLNISNMEKINIRRALINYNGNISETAKGLGISRTTLWRKMKKYDIQVR